MCIGLSPASASKSVTLSARSTSARAGSAVPAVGHQDEPRADLTEPAGASPGKNVSEAGSLTAFRREVGGKRRHGPVFRSRPTRSARPVPPERFSTCVRSSRLSRIPVVAADARTSVARLRDVDLCAFSSSCSNRRGFARAKRWRRITSARPIRCTRTSPPSVRSAATIWRPSRLPTGLPGSRSRCCVTARTSTSVSSTSRRAPSSAPSSAATRGYMR
jgi:hypothetical protein